MIQQEKFWNGRLAYLAKTRIDRVLLWLFTQLGGTSPLFLAVSLLLIDRDITMTSLLIVQGLLLPIQGRYFA